MTSSSADGNLDFGISDRSSNPISPPDYCHFTNLHPNIELDILKQLEFQDYFNLAFTCKRWYQAAVSAPRSMKPDVHFINLNMTDGCMKRNEEKGPMYIDHNITSFNLVNNVKCHLLLIFNGASSDLKSFILTNRHRFMFEMVIVSMRDVSDEDYLFVEPLFDLATKLTWLCFCKAEEMVLQFLETHLSYKNSTFTYSGSIDCIRLALKQWVNGERPDLEYFSCDIGTSTDWNEVTRDVEEFVQDKVIREDDNVLHAKIVVPGLPELIVTGGIRNTLGREFVGERQGVFLKRADLPNISIFNSW